MFATLAFNILIGLYGISTLKDTMPKGFINPLRRNFYFVVMRCFLLGAIFFGCLANIKFFLGKGDLNDALMLLESVLLASSIYFVSCTPGPGSHYRAGKWLDKLADFIFGKLASQAT